MEWIIAGKRKNINDKKKKVLCQNMVNYNSCSYGNKCSYAHSLDEQKIDENRKRAYDIVKGKNDLSNIDLHTDNMLYTNLLVLTKLCNKCVNKQCTGGYNCKFGAIKKEYVICKRDLNYGDCVGDCGLMHLTKRHLKSFYSSPTCTILSDDFFNNDLNSDSSSDVEFSDESIDDEIPDENLYKASIFD